MMFNWHEEEDKHVYLWMMFDWHEEEDEPVEELNPVHARYAHVQEHAE